MLTIALIEPQIPQNTGNIGRLCAATGTKLDIVGATGFQLSDKHLKRAGMDYWDTLNWERHPDVNAYFESLVHGHFFLFSSKATIRYTSISFPTRATLVFGNENKGLSNWILEKYSKAACKIPMIAGARCLNLSTSAGIALYEALRQQDFEQLPRF